LFANQAAITWHWARTEPRSASRKVERRHSQGLLAETGLVRRGPAWVTLLGKLGCGAVPSRECWEGTQRQQGSRGGPQILPTRKAESPLKGGGKMSFKNSSAQIRSA